MASLCIDNCIDEWNRMGAAGLISRCANVTEEKKLSKKEANMMNELDIRYQILDITNDELT